MPVVLQAPACLLTGGSDTPVRRCVRERVMYPSPRADALPLRGGTPLTTPSPADSEVPSESPHRARRLDTAAPVASPPVTSLPPAPRCTDSTSSHPDGCARASAGSSDD